MATRRAPGITIRVAVAADAGFILSLAPRFAAIELPPGYGRRAVVKATRNFMDAALRAGSPAERFLVAADARHRHAGFVQLRVHGDGLSGARVAHIANLAVAVGHEGHGVGRALLRAAQRWARARRCTRLTLNVFPGNHHARALYDQAGFQPDLIRMAKALGHSRTRGRIA